MRYWYDGPTEFKKMSPVAKKAYQSWVDQRARCNNKKHKCYKYYGARGIRVEYSSREFVGWWIANHSLRPLWSKAVCGRIDHDDNYCFENIVLQEQSDNANELIYRRDGLTNLGHKVKRVGILDSEDNVFAEFKSIEQAARELDICSSTIVRHLKGKFGRAGGFRFKVL